mgnify:FL=1
MKAVIKGFTIVASDIEIWSPEDPRDFCMEIYLRIGGASSEAADNFDLTVCTPTWLAKATVKSPVWGRGLLIVSEYDLDLIRSEVAAYVSKYSGKNWTDLATKLSRSLLWEFEDYVD